MRTVLNVILAPVCLAIGILAVISSLTLCVVAVLLGVGWIFILGGAVSYFLMFG